jgi:hypothetical protein
MLGRVLSGTKYGVKQVRGAADVICLSCCCTMLMLQQQLLPMLSNKAPSTERNMCCMRFKGYIATHTCFGHHCWVA